MTLMYLLLIIAAIVAILFAVAGYIFFKFAITRKSIKVKGKRGAYDPWGSLRPAVLAGAEWNRAHLTEKINILSRDGLSLRGYYLAAAGEQKRIVLLAHGYRGTWYGDFSNVIRHYHENGCGVLVIDERAHGYSGGDYITFGIKERYDIADFADYLCARFGSGMPVYLHGLSMGCSSVFMALGLPLPENVIGAIGDCGFTSPPAIFKHFMKSLYHLPVYPLLWFFNIYCRLLAGFSIYDCSATDSLKRAAVPVLFIHGDADNFVPTEMSRVNYAACSAPKELLLIKGATHATCSLVSPDEFFAAIDRLFAGCERDFSPIV